MVVLMRLWWWRGIAFANARPERGLRAKNPKSSHWGSISGAPSEIGVESSEGRWCNGVDEGVVMVVRCVRKREAGEGAWAKKPKPSCRGSISGAPYEIAKGDGAEG